MVGGIIVQVVPDGRRTYVEVLENTYFSRTWRVIRPRDDTECYGILVGDTLWWQSHVGFLSRRDENGEPILQDLVVGECQPADNPLSRVG